MGIKLSKRNSIKIKNLLPKGSEYEHLDLDGETIIRKDTDFEIPEIENKTSGYFPSLVRLWPEWREDTGTLTVSFDSGIDTIH